MKRKYRAVEAEQLTLYIDYNDSNYVRLVLLLASNNKINKQLVDSAFLTGAKIFFDRYEKVLACIEI